MRDKNIYPQSLDISRQNDAKIIYNGFLRSTKSVYLHHMYLQGQENYPEMPMHMM